MNKKGFTMIEVLVVMVILAAMMTMGVSTYSKSLARGRDTRRVEDMKEVQKGFEFFYANSDNQSYGSCYDMFDLDTVFPKGKPIAQSGGYPYVLDCTPNSYFACALLENPKDYGNAIYDGTNPPTFVEKSDTDISHFCVTNLQ